MTEIPLELVSASPRRLAQEDPRRNVDAVTPREEMRRHIVLVQWLTVYGVAIYWALRSSRSRTAPGT